MGREVECTDNNPTADGDDVLVVTIDGVCTDEEEAETICCILPSSKFWSK